MPLPHPDPAGTADALGTVPAGQLPGADSASGLDTSTPTAEDLPPVSARFIWLQVLAQFGVFVAFITPLAISLAIRIGQLAPGHAEYLGYITGAGAAYVLLTLPLLGTLSDRTRSRFGRRKPWMLAGMLLGVVSLLVMATAPTIILLAVGWVLAQAGWGLALNTLQWHTADKLPESQRGKVAGLTGFATQIGPVIGVILSSGVNSNNLLLFLVPGLVGVVFVSLYILLIRDDDSRGAVFADRLSLGSLFGRYVFNPRRLPDFSWNWLFRFAFYFGITLNTTFTANFFAQRLNLSITGVQGIISILGASGILAVTLGAIGGGFLSDRVHRRRPFVILSSVIFAAGAVTMALSPSLPLLVAGSLISSVGLGTFAAVDQALLLDLLPEKSTEAGRYMGIAGFATSIPQAVAPLVASVLLLVGVSGSEKNYTLLYFIAAAVVLLGAFAITRIRAVR